MTTIIIPMAGQSSRFYNAGYTIPKYRLMINGKSVFYHSLESFHNFKNNYYLFIGINGILDISFVKGELNLLGIDNYDIVLLDEVTNGQAETVFNGLQKINKKTINDIFIFNIDTFRKKIVIPATFDLKKCAGYLETFIGSGDNWSNVLPSNSEPYVVSLTAEKQSISQYCCTGLYYFSHVQFFYESYCDWIEQHSDETEVYIAPLYNFLIKKGHRICFTVIDKKEVIFCGVPSEYEEIQNGFSWE